jgi:hypothetical protein
LGPAASAIRPACNQQSGEHDAQAVNAQDRFAARDRDHDE